MSEGEDEGSYLASIEDIKKCKLDIVAGEKSNSVWLVLDDSYALTKNKEFKNGKSVWECRGRRHNGCPFKMEIQIEGDVLSVIWMYNVKTHTCAQQAVDIYVHRFKAEVKAEMANNFRSKYMNVYNSNKKRLLDSIADPDLRELVSGELPAVVSYSQFLSVFSSILFKYV